MKTFYTETEQSHLEFAADYWDIPVGEIQKAGVMAIRYINGLAGTTGSNPLRPRPTSDGPTGYSSDWAPDERRALDWVSHHHELSYSETQKLGAIVMIYVAAVASQ